MKFQLEEYELSGDIGDSYLSRREGYYCLKDVDGENTIDNSKTGAEVGDEINCAAGDGKDLDRRKSKIVYTHEAWLTLIRDRTRSTGDCGYKPHAYFDITGYKGDVNSEVIDVTFQVLNQKGETKYNTTEKEIIYKGDETVPSTEYRD